MRWEFQAMWVERTKSGPVDYAKTYTFDSKPRAEMMHQRALEGGLVNELRSEVHVGPLYELDGDFKRRLAGGGDTADPARAS